MPTSRSDDSKKASKRGRPSLAPWRPLAEDPSRWGALGDGEKRRLGEALRDLFFAERGADDALGRALLAAARPEPVAQVDGLDVSFYPGGRFCKVRFVDERLVAPASLRPLFARPAAPSLLAVFVDPREFSFRTFENLIPLDRHFARCPASLALTDRRPLGSRGGAWSFSVAAPEPTREALARLDGLGLYVPPLDDTARGGERFIFHAARLAEALTRAISGAMGDVLGGPGVFSHVNPVFRCNRFEPGDGRFHRHLDNPYFDRDRRHVSRYTLLLYLTGGQGAPALQIGDDVALASIDAMTCVVFDQRLEHEGSPYTGGRKVFLRSELIFQVERLAELPAAGQSFARACYLAGESLLDPGLARAASAQFHRAAAARWGAPGEDDAPEETFVHKTFRGVHFVASGHDFWFPKGALSLPECAALTLLDFFNARVDGAPFRSLCSAEVVRGDAPGWIERLLGPHAAPPGEPVFAPLDPRSLFPPAPAPDQSICCSYHTSQFHLHPSVIDRYTEAQRFARERLASAPVALMGQQILVDPARFIVEDSRIHVLSARALAPVHFAACQNGSIPPGVLVGVRANVEALQPLVPPILFAETDGCHHLMFDFFRNSWMVDFDQETAPIPALIEKLDDPQAWGASPWDAVEERLRGADPLDSVAGSLWWQGRPVWVSFEGREIDASDPTTDADTLEALLLSGDRRARVAAAGNPNLPADALERLLAPEIDREDAFERGEEHVAAWQNPATPVLMLQRPSDVHEEAARLVLLWLEHLHGVRKGDPGEPLQGRVERWGFDLSAPPGLAQGHAIVRDFALHLGALFSLFPPISSDFFPSD